MTQRSYDQYCPIAHALDVVGERWSLLIVRDLLLGPKRFSDLRVGLPGIGTNILTDRLKQLEQAGVIVRRTLPPPAAAQVYELTEYGRDLDQPIQTLAAWGARSLGALTPNATISPDSIRLTARALARQLHPGAEPATFAFTLRAAPEAVPFRVALGAGEAVVIAAPPSPADLVLDLSAETLFALAGGQITLQAAVAAGLVSIAGPALRLAASFGPEHVTTKKRRNEGRGT